MNNSTTRVNRITWLDTSRGLAFIMVIFHHLDLSNDVGNNFIFPVFLTTFFFVSGYLFKEKVSFSKMLEHRIRTLLIPFVILGSFLILVSSVVSYNEKQIGIRESFIELFTQYGYVHINTMWFIPSLFVYSIVFHLFMSINSGWKWMTEMAFVTFFLNWLYIYIINGPILPWHIHYLGFACTYMFLGKIYKSCEKEIDKIATVRCCVLALIIYLSYIFFSGNSCNFYGSPWGVDSILLSLLGLFVMIKISKTLNSKFVRFVGANTLLYFAFHGKVMSLVNIILNRLDIYVNGSLSIYEAFLIAKAILIAILLIPICIIINKYLPQILGKNYKLW